MTTVTIVDYGLGNLRSLAGAIEKIGHTPVISSDPRELARASRLILPGVGAFGDGMKRLGERGLVDALNRAVIDGRTPILGICLGAQLMCSGSEEFGWNDGLDWFAGRVLRIRPHDAALRVPHVGWNELAQSGACCLFDGIPGDALFYYVHSFCIHAEDRRAVAGQCDYGDCFDAALWKDNVYAVQFHPEKSQAHGLRMLKNFVDA